MRFACEQCQTKYSIPDERVRGKILKIRCKTCGCLISVSEGGVRTARPMEPEPGPGLASGESEGGDSTMIGGMADFFGKLGQPPPPEGEEWHLSIDGNQNGPMPLNDVAQRVLEQAGTSSELFVWKDGYEGWKTADEIPEIQAAVEKARGGGAKSAPSAQAPGKTAGPSLASESEGGDATQIGSLNLNFDAAKEAAKDDDDDVQDASMLSLDADALEAFSSAVAASKPAAKPPARPAAPPPPKAPPPFKSPPAPLFKTLPHPGGRPLPAAAPPPKPAAAPPPPAAAPPPVAAPPPPAAPPAPEPDLASLIPQGASVSPPPSSSGMGGPSPSSSGAPPPALPSAEPSVMAALQFGGSFDSAAAPAQPAGSSEPAKKSSNSKLPLVAGLGVLLALGGIGGVVMLSRSGKGKVVATDSGKADAGAADAGAGADAGAKALAVKEPPKKSADLEGISDADFKDLLESGESALAKCYGKALKKDSSLAGSVLKVEVEVTAKGKASEVNLDGKEADGKLGKCVQKAVKKWKFAKGEDKKPYKVRFPLTVKE